MHMKKGPLVLVLVVLILLVAFLVLAFGVIDLNLYRSEVALDRVGTSGLSRPGGDETPLGYNLDIYYEGELVASSSQHVVGGEVFDIRIDLDPTISGNDWMPISKSFTVEFSTSFQSSIPDSLYEVDGEIDGTADVTVVGFCSRRKAHELARDEIVESVEDHIQSIFEE
jgi:hypothetical protein